MSNDNEYSPGGGIPGDEVMPEDEQPKSGVFVDHEPFFQELTPEEIAEGERLGAETPDVDYIEDEDGNLIPIEPEDE